MTIRRAPNLVFEGRKPKRDETNIIVETSMMRIALTVADDLAQIKRRLAALEREAQCNGNGERG